jgi:hypothetical protein
LASPTEYEENGAISFVQPVQLGQTNIKKTTVVRGLDLSLALQVTPLMTIEMLLDETVGDIIRGRGEGTVRVDYPPTGDLRLNGTVTLTSGDYLFTLQNLINKSFEVEPGGTLSWTGDPYAGTLNMRAFYTTRTALTGMVNQPDYAGQRVPVQLGLGLSGPLMQPQLAFDFALPNANPAWQEELRNRLADADKRNIQAFSLLLTNGFWQSNDGVLSQGVQSVNSNTTQMLASQFSNFLSQGLGDLISIDLAYSGSNRSDARDQLEVALSKAFLNDRIAVQTTLDVPMGKQAASNSTSGLPPRCRTVPSGASNHGTPNSRSRTTIVGSVGIIINGNTDIQEGASPTSSTPAQKCYAIPRIATRCDVGSRALNRTSARRLPLGRAPDVHSPYTRGSLQC